MKECSNCGKNCGSAAHSNMEGKFKGKTYCDVCFTILEKNLSKSLTDMCIEGRNIVFDHSMPYQYNDRIKEQKDILETEFKKVRNLYKDLTGVAWK